MQTADYKNGGGRGFCISQSSIKAWRNFSPKKWYRKYVENIEDDENENPAFLLGEILDTLITCPDKLEERFYIANMEKIPSETECKIIECTYNQIIEYNNSLKELNEVLPEEPEFLKIDLAENWDILLSCCNTEKWQSGWKDDTRVNKIIERGNAYFSILAEANHRKIISSSLNMQAIELIEILKANKHTRDYLVESPDNELHFQLEIFAEYDYEVEFEDPIAWHEIREPEIRKIPIKGALDIFRVDHKNKTYQIVDFKKTFSTHEFKNNIYKFNYDMQLSFYQYLISKLIEQDANFYYLKDYKQLPPINIAIDIVDKTPCIYSYSERDLYNARYGNEKFLEGAFGKHHQFRIKKGWNQLLDEIAWHICKNDFSECREMLENGIIQLNLINN